MIGIRTVTYQLPKLIRKEDIKKVEKLSRIWDNEYSFIRTQRVSLCPYVEPEGANVFKDLSLLCDVSSVRWYDVPIKPIEPDSKLFLFAYDLLAENIRSFVNILSVDNGVIDPWIMNQSAELIRSVSTISADGKDNFRLGMSVNVNADGPFFPFTYSSGSLGFSIGLELTQDINVVCEKFKNKGLVELRNDIINCLIPQIDSINKIAEKISKNNDIEFKGFDFSLAPIIDPNGSVVSILNTLGIYDFGKTGNFFATGYLTNILKYLASIYKSVGFSGVMYSLLEDLELCAINNERGVSLEQMISLSTMCGCGVDMIPVYGKITNEEMISIFMDIVGISCRLNNKPLGIRILPIPNCKRGQQAFTSFFDDPDFIANTKVVTPRLNLLNGMENSFSFLKVN